MCVTGTEGACVCACVRGGTVGDRGRKNMSMRERDEDKRLCVEKGAVGWAGM
jgi:hypothetical protein